MCVFLLAFRDSPCRSRWQFQTCWGELSPGKFGEDSEVILMWWQWVGWCHHHVEYPEKRGPNGCLGYRRDELLTQIYRNYFIEYYKDPYFFTTVVFHGIRKGPRVFFGWLMKLVSLDVPATCRSFSWPWTTITMAL